MPAPYPKATRQRILADIRDQIRVKGYTRTMNDISHANDISRKTLESWWTQYKKAKASVQAQEERPSPPYGKELESDAAGLGNVPHGVEPPPAPKPAQLVINGVLRCSRCKSEHIERRGEEEFYCLVCQKILLFDGWYRETTVPYFPGAGRYSWMR